MTDPIADMLTRIKNASMTQKREVLVPYSKMKLAIAQVMKQEGFLNEVEKIGEGIEAQLRILLAYRDGEPACMHFKRVSKPSRRMYVGYKEVPLVLNGLGIVILSTSRGIMSGKEARKQKLGGEFICEVA